MRNVILKDVRVNNERDDQSFGIYPCFIVGRYPTGCIQTPYMMHNCHHLRFKAVQSTMGRGRIPSKIFLLAGCCRADVSDTLCFSARIGTVRIIFAVLRGCSSRLLFDPFRLCFLSAEVIQTVGRVENHCCFGFQPFPT